MATVIELKYFNTFWLKKIKSVVDVVPSTTKYTSNVGATFTVALVVASEMKVGQQVTIVDGVNTYSSYVKERNSNTEFVGGAIPAFTITGGVDINFGKIINFDQVPSAYAGSNANDWLIEESRIRGGYNNTSIDYGVKAYFCLLYTSPSPRD